MDVDHFVFISIGSNMGDKIAVCEKAVEHIDSSLNMSLLAVSKYYKTEPVDYLDQDWFVNLAVKIKTDISPENLLQQLKNIEKLLGTQKKYIRFGPRILDLDIIFYDNIIIDTENIQIPHPRMHKRRFVLKPISDIEPDFIHPIIKISVKKLLYGLDKNIQKVLVI